LRQKAAVIVEDYLAGQEATITVMPPSPALGHDDYWAMPVIERFNHAEGKHCHWNFRPGVSLANYTQA
jgi:hypothetical protein